MKHKDNMLIVNININIHCSKILTAFIYKILCSFLLNSLNDFYGQAKYAVIRNISTIIFIKIINLL